MDLQRIAQQFQSPGLPVRARFGTVVSVNSDRTLNVLVGGETTDADVEAAFASGFEQMDATGGTLGTVTVEGIDYRTHTFTTAGTFVVTDAGLNADLQVLLVAGGGGGGGADSFYGGGGGGAGRVVELDFVATLGSAVVAIGTAGLGGSSTPTAGGDGGDSQITFPDASVAIAVGGGGGGRGASTQRDGRTGGSGGGAGGSGAPGIAADTLGYGNDGGDGVIQQTGAGGGGSGGVGLNGRSDAGGNGGLTVPLTSVAITGSYGGGGGGGASNRPGGVGGGDAGDGGSNAAGENASGYGNGGGGGGNNDPGGNGSAGIAVFAYRLTPPEDVNDVPVEDGSIESNEVDEVRFLGRSVPIPGQTVLLLTDGQDLLAIDSMAADGTTIAPRRYRTTDQTIPSGTGTVVEFGTAVANDLLGMDGPVGGTAWPSRLYAHIPGWYQATVGSYWGSSSDDVDTWVRYNGSTVLARQSESTDATHPLYQSVTTPVFYMAVDDYVEMMVAHDAGSDRTLVYDSEYLPSMSLTFIGP